MFFPFGKKKLVEKDDNHFARRFLSRDAMAQKAVELAEAYSFIHEAARGVKLQTRFKENTKIPKRGIFSFSEA